MIQRLDGLGDATPLAFWLVLLACAYLLVTAVRLTVIDVRHHLLPDRIVFPSYAVAGVLLLGAAAVHAVSGAPASAAVPDGGAGLFGVPGLRVVAGGAALWLFYFLLRAVYPPGMGFGDVKLAGRAGDVPGLPRLAARFRRDLRRLPLRRAVEPGPARARGAAP